MTFSVAGFPRYGKYNRHPVYTKLGHIAQPIGAMPVNRRGTNSIVRTLGRYTTLSHMCGFCPPYTSPTSRTLNNINITVSNTPAITFTSLTPTTVQDIVLAPTGRIISMLPLNPPTVIEGGSTVDLTAVTPTNITFTTLTPTVSVDATNDRVVNVSNVGTMTFTAQTPTLVNDIGVLVSNTVALTFTAQTPTLIPGSLGQQNLTSQDLIAIWDDFVVDKNSQQNFSASDAFRLIIAATIAKSFGFKDLSAGAAYSQGDQFGYLDLDGTRVRIRCVFTGPNRFTVELFPDP